jgi:hypothetical protein
MPHQRDPVPDLGLHEGAIDQCHRSVEIDRPSGVDPDQGPVARDGLGHLVVPDLRVGALSVEVPGRTVPAAAR